VGRIFRTFLLTDKEESVLFDYDVVAAGLTAKAVGSLLPGGVRYVNIPRYEGTTSYEVMYGV
jgi:hypothetical protein